MFLLVNIVQIININTLNRKTLHLLGHHVGSVLSLSSGFEVVIFEVAFAREILQEDDEIHSLEAKNCHILSSKGGLYSRPGFLEMKVNEIIYLESFLCF